MRIAVFVSLVFVLMASAFAETVPPPTPLDAAKALFDQGKYAEAIPILDKIASSDPAAPQALKMMGECYKAQRNWPQATKYFEKALTYPDASLQTKDIRIQLMDCYLADNGASRGFACLDRLVADYPDDAARFHYVVGRRYQWMHQYAEAAKELREAVKLPTTDPDAKDAAKRYICCCLSAMDFDGALAYLPTFVSDYPDSIPEVVSKELYRWKFKIPKVVEIIEKAASGTDKDTTELKIGLADCYVATNNWDKGLATLNGIPTSRRCANWRVAMAKCYWGQNKKSRAVEELKQAIKNGSDLDSKKLLMEYYRGTGDRENMLAQAKLLEKEWPANAGEWLMNQGWALLEMDRCEDAVPVFREAISRYPDNRWVVRGSMVSLAECLYGLDKADEAMADLKAYYDKHPDLKSEYLFVSGQIQRYGPHDNQQSIAILNKLIAEHPTDPLANEASKFLVPGLEAAGQWGEATSILEAQLNGMPSWRDWDRIPVLQQLADCKFRSKEYAEAIDLYREVIASKYATKETYLTAMYRLGMCQQETGDLEEAKHTYRAVLKQYAVPEVVRAKTMCALAICYWQTGLKDAARRLMQEVADKYPDMEEAMNARGYLYIWTEGRNQESNTPNKMN